MNYTCNPYWQQRIADTFDCALNTRAYWPCALTSGCRIRLQPPMPLLSPASPMP